MSREDIIATGTCPPLLQEWERPTCRIFMNEDLHLEMTWEKNGIGPDLFECFELHSRVEEISAACWTGPRQAMFTEFSIRQRPVIFGGGAAYNYYATEESQRTRREFTTILSADLAHDCVFGFWSEPPKNAWYRTPLNLHDVPTNDSGPNRGLWLETETDGTYRLGYFDTGGKSLEEVRAQFMAGQLPRPGELLVGQAERTEPYRAVLYGGRDSLLFPDLRFDDEM